MNSLISLITQTGCKLEKLSIAGNSISDYDMKLFCLLLYLLKFILLGGGKYGIKADLIPFIQALSSNESITELDIRYSVLRAFSFYIVDMDLVT